MNSKLSERKTEKHGIGIRMLNRDGGLKADENWMSAEISWVLDVARGQKDMVGDQSVQGFEGQGGKFKPHTFFSSTLHRMIK